jgi:hypothetical protein
MKNIMLFIVMYFSFSVLKSEITIKAKSPEDKDLSCITLLKIASKQSKENGEMVKYEKLKKLKKSYLSRYANNHFSDKDLQLKSNEHNLKIKEKGMRYINKGLQKCGLK